MRISRVSDLLVRAGARGTVNQNDEPRPSMLSKPMVPPISSTRRFEIASPRPVPPYCRRRRGVDLAEALEEPVLLVEGDADAGVADGEAEGLRPWAAVLVDIEVDAARRRELDGVVEEVQQHLPDARLVADDDRAGRPSATRTVSISPFASASLRMIESQFAIIAFRRERPRIEVDGAGLDLREVEDVVDDREQRGARRADAFGVAAQVRRQIVAVEDRDP